MEDIELNIKETQYCHLQMCLKSNLNGEEFCMSGRSTNFWPGEEILVIPLIPLTPPETVPALGVSAATFGEKPNSLLLPMLHFKAFNWIFPT